MDGGLQGQETEVACFWLEWPNVGVPSSPLRGTDTGQGLRGGRGVQSLELLISSCLGGTAVRMSRSNVDMILGESSGCRHTAGPCMCTPRRQVNHKGDARENA